MDRRAKKSNQVGGEAWSSVGKYGPVEQAEAAMLATLTAIGRVKAAAAANEESGICDRAENI